MGKSKDIGVTINHNMTLARGDNDCHPTSAITGLNTVITVANSAYQKPGLGIPSTDFAAAAIASLGKADSAYQKPGLGIPYADVTNSVQSSLNKADSSYQKPASGIPLTDIMRGLKSVTDAPYNAIGDGVANDTTAIQAAITASDYVFLPAGTYLVTANITDVTAGRNIVIAGVPGQTTIKIKNGSRIKYIFGFENSANVIISGITFDMNVQNTTPYVLADYASGSYNEAVYCKSTTNLIDVRNCKFINLYNEAIFLYQTASSVRIINNIFTSPAQAQNLRLSHILLQTITTSGNLIISDNMFDNVQPTAPQYGVNAIFAEGVKSQTIITRNKLNWCGRDNTGAHRLLAIDLYGNCNYFTISDNVVDNCLWGFLRIESCQEITVERNKFFQNGGVVLTDPAIWITSTVVYAQNGKNVRIKDNEFYAYTASRIVSAVAIYSLDWSKPLQNIEVSGNSVWGAIDTFVQITAGIDTVAILNNKCLAFNGATPQQLVKITRIGTVEPSTAITPEVNTSTTDIRVAGNQWFSAGGAINMNLSTYTGTIDQLIIENNNLKGVTGMGDSININNIPCTIRNNFMRNNPEGVTITGAKKAYIFNNILETMDNGAFYLVGASNYVQAGNYYNGVLVP